MYFSNFFYIFNMYLKIFTKDSYSNCHKKIKKLNIAWINQKNYNQFEKFILLINELKCFCIIYFLSHRRTIVFCKLKLITNYNCSWPCAPPQMMYMRTRTSDFEAVRKKCYQLQFSIQGKTICTFYVKMPIIINGKVRFLTKLNWVRHFINTGILQ